MCCYDSPPAMGESTFMKDYSPDQEKHFLIYLYPLEDRTLRLCAAGRDGAPENGAEAAPWSMRSGKTFLEATTEIDFEYDLATDTLAFGSDGERVSREEPGDQGRPGRPGGRTAS